MGMATRIYGCIVEYGLLQGALQQSVYDHNERIINEIPLMDPYPPISRTMFAITSAPPDDTGPILSYSGRIIHFGANVKSLEYDWKEWKSKFEDLLTKLLWLSADVHFKPEYADIQTFKWRIDLLKWQITAGTQIESVKPEYWEFEGDKTWENL